MRALQGSPAHHLVAENGVPDYISGILRRCAA
jgi:hypothetical protein